MAHYNASGHEASVKLGTITAEGNAGEPAKPALACRPCLLMEVDIDIYCYKCDDSRLDPELQAHLAALGINVMNQEKTEKTITELASLLQFEFFVRASELMYSFSNSNTT